MVSVPPQRELQPLEEVPVSHSLPVPVPVSAEATAAAEEVAPEQLVEDLEQRCEARGPAWEMKPG